MKIGISLLSARNARTGVENVAFNLVKQLDTISSPDEYVVFANTRCLTWLSNLGHGIQVIHVSPTGERALWIWEHLFFLNDSRCSKMDLVHFPIGGGVVGYRGRFILTIHDLKHYLHRDQVAFRRFLLWQVWCRSNIPRATRIIAISNYVKQDVLREFPGQARNVRLIYNGVDLRFRPRIPPHAFKTKYQLPPRCVLFVGATSKNKNLKRAIEAMSILHTKYGIEHKLIIAGQPGDDDYSLKQYVESKNLHNVVDFLGYVVDDDLPELYCSADLFLFPSISEGFGIPPLEAMRCGLPVVAARSNCLPEVLGDAPIWVDPLSPESIAEGIRVGLLDHEARSCAIAKGFERADQFSWKAMALQTIDLYHEALESPRC